MEENSKVQFARVIVTILVVIIAGWTISYMLSDEYDMKSKKANGYGTIKVLDTEVMLMLREGEFIDAYGNVINYYIVVDSETGVEYYMSNSKNNKGSLTPLYNADGSLKVVEEGLKYGR